jgi:GDP/UDP-N,N'-diacetylbacillosamine 2-epimerase (hydrolysing)
MRELLAALETLPDTHIVFTLPNADPEGRQLIDAVHEFVARCGPRAKAFASLGQQRYLSLVAQVDAVVGNSSSGLAEVPSFRKPTINIGDRQRGRLKAQSVIDCEPTRASISAALERAGTPEFRHLLETAVNPYGSGGASERVVEVLERTSFDGLLKKTFHDLAVAPSTGERVPP